MSGIISKWKTIKKIWSKTKLNDCTKKQIANLFNFKQSGYYLVDDEQAEEFMKLYGIVRSKK